MENIRAQEIPVFFCKYKILPPLPTAVLLDVDTFAARAVWPTAVLFTPLVFVERAPCPTAVLFAAPRFAPKALLPTAVLLDPVVFASSAATPKTVLVTISPDPRPTMRVLIVRLELVKVGAPLRVRELIPTETAPKWKRRLYIFHRPVDGWTYGPRYRYAPPRRRVSYMKRRNDITHPRAIRCLISAPLL